MEQSRRKSSVAERRASSRRSARMSSGSIGTSDDEYDLSAMMVSDGFRPAALTDITSSSQSTRAISPPPSSSHDSQTESTASTSQSGARSSLSIPRAPALVESSSKTNGLLNRPSSISKPHRPHDSLTLRNDGSGNAPPANRSIAGIRDGASNSTPIVRVESPYRGPSGPSHPYNMYPQRTQSVASNSTAGRSSDRPFQGHQGPAHPYALYTQNTVPIDEGSEQHIPVGFNGMGSTYQRQLGPDGEEAGDLIGPLGHMEELPPYTRYPMESFARDSPQDSPSRSPAGSTPGQALSPVDAGAGGIGIATRNPEFSPSDEDLRLARSRPSIRSATSDFSNHEINTAARSVAEKPRVGKWQRRAKNKIFGVVPVWAICLLFVAVMVLGIVMGAVIGTVLTKHGDGDEDADEDEHEKKPDYSSIVPLQEPPRNLKPATTGFWSLPPLYAKQAPNDCLVNYDQSPSWSCDMPFRFYQLDIEPIPDAPDTMNYEISLTAINASDSQYLWGTQPPEITEPKTLALVNDTSEPNWGPAWYLKYTYDKTVVIPEDSLSTSSSRRRRSSSIPPPSGGYGSPDHFSKKNIGAMEGDMPWICTWPKTTVEILVFPNQNTSAAFTSSTASTTSTLPTTTTSAGYTSPTESPDEALDSYPQLVKLLERRLDSHSDARPSCRQVQIVDNGYDDVDVMDDNGDPVVVDIDEEEHQWAKRAFGEGTWLTNAIAARGDPTLTDCSCLWLSG